MIILFYVFGRSRGILFKDKIMTCLFFFFLAAFTPFGIIAEIHTIEGVRFQGQIIELTDKDEWVYSEEGELKSLDINNIHSVYFIGEPKPVRPAFEAGIRLVDGSYLGGTLEGGHEESVYFRHSLLGRLSIPVDLIAKLILASPSIPQDFERHGQKEEDDVLFKKSKGMRGRDYITGTLERFTEDGLEFDCTLGMLNFDYPEIEAVTLAQPLEFPRIEGRKVSVVFRDGSGMFYAGLVGIQSGKARFSTPIRDPLSVSLAAIGSILFFAEDIHHLSDMEPVEVEEVPYIGDKGSFIYPLRRDRTVTGRMLSCKGRTFAKGLGLHAFTRVTYPLEKKYRALETFVGICDEVLELPAEGSVVFAISVDDQEAFKSPIIRGGHPPLKLPRIDLREASFLTLTVDFADGFDSGDRALIGNPVLIKTGR